MDDITPNGSDRRTVVIDRSALEQSINNVFILSCDTVLQPELIPLDDIFGGSLQIALRDVQPSIIRNLDIIDIDDVMIIRQAMINMDNMHGVLGTGKQ